MSSSHHGTSQNTTKRLGRASSWDSDKEWNPTDPGQATKVEERRGVVESVGGGGVSSPSKKVLPFFRPSRFSNVPPTVRFYLPNEKVQKPRKQVVKMLKWCHNPLIPKVIRKCLTNNHFQIVDEKLYWMGYWGRHWKSERYRHILPFQRVNHFPGSFNLGRKDKLWANIHRMALRHGQTHFNIIPKTYVLPKDKKALKAKMRESDQIFIVKPPASARGNGIKVIHKWSQVPSKPVVVQCYIERPLLIVGRKFDMRIYVCVTSFNPLRVYLYDEGIARFATVRYSHSVSSLKNRFIHLTNYSINRKAIGDRENGAPPTLHKWSLKALMNHLKNSTDCDLHNIEEKITDLIIKAIISAESLVNLSIHQNSKFPFVSNELYGFDIILDEKLKPWLLEINISPSLQCGTGLDWEVKGPLARDTLNLSGIQVPDKDKVAHHLKPSPSHSSTSDTGALMDYRTKPWLKHLSEEELEKQDHFADLGSGTSQIRWERTGIVDELTPSDVRVLVETENEWDRRGQFTRIFPTPETGRKYLQFMEKPRYYNFLLAAWTTLYSLNREEGCMRLEAACKSGVHLKTSLESQLL